MKNKVIKTAVVSAAVMAFALIPASQAFAWCGGYCGEYNPPAQQRYVPQSYAPAQISTNAFDPTVYEVQSVLFENGYYEGEIDGLLGEKTKAALLSFREDNGIPQTDGADAVALKADSATLEALGL